LIISTQLARIADGGKARTRFTFRAMVIADRVDRTVRSSKKMPTKQTDQLQ
jgi:hypothetical protein